MADVEKALIIAAPIERVWAALTDAAAIGEWMLDEEVEVDLQVGGAYAFFDKETRGHFTHIQAITLLEYTWRQGSWPKEWGDSLVHWELKTQGENTQVMLRHNRFPNDEERDSHDEGWDMYWIEPMQEWLESNA
jgi:uncharacterized protein YndB with AHSA1/START domain